MKMDPLLRYLKRFHGKRLLLDTNLLLPYFEGCFYQVNLQVQKHASFKQDEFELLAQIIEHFKKAGKVLTTPHLLTELSNISERLKANRVAFLNFIRHMIRDLDERFDENRIGAARLSGQDCFLRFGLADAAIIDLAYDPLLLLTNDQPMARYLIEVRRRTNVLYFGDLKQKCFGETEQEIPDPPINKKVRKL
jgi:hypothetical protein